MNATGELGEIHRKIREELPELAGISKPELADKVVEAWAKSLSEGDFRAIGDLQGSGGPDVMVLKKGTQVDHLRGVTRIAMRLAEELAVLQSDFRYDRDVLIAGALIHDVGKPFEYDPRNRGRWLKAPRASGLPAARHTLHGYHVCMSVGLPVEVAHIAGAHSPEGDLIIRSRECTIVHHADEAYWQILRASGLLADVD